LGAGGIGMSALARYFNAKGHQVSGYDKTPTPLTEALIAEGVNIHFEDNVKAIPQEVLDNPDKTLVVLTPAVPKDHSELNFFRENNFTIKKRSEVLGLVAGQAYTIAVAGTHGKTTTSSMVAHLLNDCGVNCSAFLGGISVNLESNLLIGETENGKDIVVVEADEYDRSFLTLHPDIAVVTSTDADHLDIYGDKDHLVHSFRDFVSQIRPNGTLIINKNADQQILEKIDPSVRVITYSLESGDLHAGKITIDKHTFLFDIKSPLGDLENMALPVPGFHNVENAMAACLAAQLLGESPEKIRLGLQKYKGVKRRFEFVSEGKDYVYIDDYAHHPREIEALLNSLKALYPGKKIKVIFQPHLFSRTRDFADGFAESLSQADELVLLPIYPAREKPIEGVTSDLLLRKINLPEKALFSKEEVLENLRTNRNFDVLATVGAGDIDTLVKPIKNILENR
ncbi:MAG TPA: UDP-N-acetylmuramate--L-alanine ligase, partial [Adhaeribacter sp.]|nr:UDP-N-acetylmuramate--L-alanine ligase [Adhaeribacter sp.]